MESKSNSSTSVKYHDIFDYKLTKEEVFRWQYKNTKETTSGIKNKSRLQREKFSKKKLLIAKGVANLLSKIPTVKFVGITGSLAMMNSNYDSDIDLLIITSAGTLWLTRFVILVILVILVIPFRRFGKDDEKDKLCLNMWMDESDLIWNKKDRNIYTAHEIAQVVPLINKDKIYEKFLYLNKWILDYWPNSVKIKNLKLKWSHLHDKNLKLKINNLISLIEYLAFKLQYLYMSRKITREIVTLTRAIFHPNDWGKVVLKKLSS